MLEEVRLLFRRDRGSRRAHSRLHNALGWNKTTFFRV